MKIKLLLIVIVFLSTGTPGALVLAHSEREPDTRVIHMTGEGFSPKEVTIMQGEKVTFENVGTKSHWPASNIHPTHSVYPGSDIRKCDDENHKYVFDACGEVLPGGEYSFVFDEPGTWKFHDHLNPQLSGSVTVVEDSDYIEDTTVFSSNEKTSLWDLITEEVLVLFSKIYYQLFPEKGQKKLNELSMYIVALDDDALRYWMKIFGTERILDDLIKDSSNGRYGCHLEAHLVGRMSYKVYGTAPFDIFDDRCQFGYFHGLLESFIGDQGVDSMVQEMDKYCTSLETRAYRIKCFHGVGHGLTVFNNYDLPEAIAQCEELSPDFQTFCYDGAFMENGATSIDFDVAGEHESEWVSNDPYFPCNAFPSDHPAQSSCYFNQPLILMDIFKKNAFEVVNACHNAPAEYIGDCYQGVGYYVAALMLHTDSITSVCSIDTHERYQRNCVLGAITLLGFVWDSEWDKVAEDVCRQFSNSIQQECFAKLKRFNVINEPDF